jgi:hypothetical protein
MGQNVAIVVSSLNMCLGVSHRSGWRFREGTVRLKKSWTSEVELFKGQISISREGGVLSQRGPRTCKRKITCVSAAGFS